MHTFLINDSVSSNLVSFFGLGLNETFPIARARDINLYDELEECRYVFESKNIPTLNTRYTQHDKKCEWEDESNSSVFVQPLPVDIGRGCVYASVQIY